MFGYTSRSQLGIANSKGTRAKPGFNDSRIITYIMVSVALIIVSLLANIMQIRSLYTAEQPSCPRDQDCIKGIQSTTTSKYAAVKDHPQWSMTDEQLKGFTFNELHQHMDCYDHAVNRTKAMYTKEMYNHMKTKYSELTGYKFQPVKPTQDVFHIALSEGAGRGVFAARDIKKGEIIPFDEACSVITFTDGQLWKEYVASLPREMACDVMEWTWLQNVQTMGDYRMCLSIGDGDSYLNDADIDEDVNIAPTSLISMKFEATKDIMKGDELIYDYEVFDPVDYERFNLGVV